MLCVPPGDESFFMLLGQQLLLHIINVQVEVQSKHILLLHNPPTYFDQSNLTHHLLLLLVSQFHSVPLFSCSRPAAQTPSSDPAVSRYPERHDSGIPGGRKGAGQRCPGNHRRGGMFNDNSHSIQPPWTLTTECTASQCFDCVSAHELRQPTSP